MNLKKIIMDKIGSSETIRKTTFNFYTYKQNLVSHKKKINVNFLQWFIGFVEGDGSFIVSNTRLFFIINQKEEKILHFIRTNLGFGKVSTYKNYSRFIVADKTNINKLIFIFNGNLVLNKTNARFVCWLNARNVYSTEKLDYLNKIQFLNLNDNAWLSGFIDAEGCFNVVRSQDSRYTLGFRVRLRFILHKKNEICILNKLKFFLTSGVITKRKIVNTSLNQLGTVFVTENDKVLSEKSEQPMFTFTCTSILSHEILIKYLTNYPLRTFKKVSFLRFTSLLRYIKNRKKIPWQNKVLRKVEKLIKNIEKLKIESG